MTRSRRAPAGTYTWTLLGGSCVTPGHVDGSPANSQFDAICSIAVDASGSVVLVSEESNWIRQYKNTTNT